MEMLMKHIDFYNHSTRVINIYGPPGFGKSTLAIHVGDAAVRKGVNVHYVNMVDMPDKEVKQGLARKILKKADFDDLLEWVRNFEYHFWYYQLLLIIDNCDEVLHSQREEFLNAITRLVESSLKVRIVLTSRELATLPEYLDWYKVNEISATAASELLDLKVSKRVGLTSSQREQIAELTENVPLALQIVSSSLNLPISPSPNKVIQELNRNIIHVLSPEDFPASQKLQNSIGLSVKYLSMDLRRYACYMVIFPGSFDEDAANSIFDSSRFVNGTARSLLTSLVKSSLLEFNMRISRYQYHRLIKEYFLRNVCIPPQETIAHYIHYAKRLNFASLELKYNYHISLSILCTERHNFQLLLDYLRKKQPVNREYFFSVAAVLSAIEVGLFRHRFSTADWCEPIDNALLQFDKLMGINESNSGVNIHDIVQVTGIAGSNFLHFYVVLIIQSANCQEIVTVDGVKGAVKVYTNRMIVVEINKRLMLSTDYIAYYVSLASYYSKLGREEYVRECHRRILHQANVTCKPKQCSNYVIGLTYKNLGNHKEAVKFLERAVKDNETILDHSMILVMLYTSYNVLQYSERKQLALENLLELRDQLINVSNSELYHSGVTQLIITIFRNNGYEQEANTLEGRLLEVILEIRAQPHILAWPMDKAYQFAQYLFNNKDYEKVVDLGAYILESLSLDEINLKLRVELLVGKAKFHAGNYSKGMDDIETVLLEISNYPGQNYTEEKSTSCWYLILRVKYIDICYNIKAKLRGVVIGVACLVLGCPLKYPKSSADQHSSRFPSLNGLNRLRLVRQKSIFHLPKRSPPKGRGH